MPGLLRGMARVAVVSGTATAVSNRVSRRQAERWASNDTVQPGYMQPRQSAAASSDVTTQLQQLAELKNQGILTEEEFTAKKRQLLGL